MSPIKPRAQQCEKPHGAKTQGFFSIDLGAFRCATAGGLNSAIAQLVMARGTGRDNKTSQWSVHAIEQYTGISRKNASTAVEDLIARGIWKKTRGGRHPVYEATSGNEIPGGPFTVQEQEVIAQVRRLKRIGADLKTVAKRLEARRILTETSESLSTYRLNEAELVALSEPVAVWLPNALVDGAAGEVAPIELIRQTRSLPALRLMVELYGVQFLPTFGGVPRKLLSRPFDRAKVGEQGQFTVWGFRPNDAVATYDLSRPFLTGQYISRSDGHRRDSGWDESFWPACRILVDLGVVERVGMLVEGDDDEAEIIHPYAIHDGEHAERQVAIAAQQAAVEMITDGQSNWANANGYAHLVPVRRHIANVAMVEVYRLKYRPHTAATAAWYATMQQVTAEYIDHYRALKPGAKSTAA